MTLPRLPTFHSFVPPATRISSLQGGVSNLGFRVGRRRGLKVELMGLGLEGGVSERRTEPPPVDPTATSRPVAPTEKPEEAEVKLESSPRKGGLKKARPKVRFGGGEDEPASAVPRADLRNTEW